MTEALTPAKERQALIGPRVQDGLLDWFGNLAFQLDTSEGGVNGLVLTTAPAGSTGPRLRPQGADANQDFRLAALGTGHLLLESPTIAESTLTVEGLLTTVDGLDVGGNTLLHGTLNVVGATTLSSTLNVSGATVLGTTLNVLGAVDFDQTLNVDGATTLHATTVTGAFTQTGGTASFDSPTLVVDAALHRVGVGTASPSTKLDVVDTQNGPAVVRLLNASAGAAGQAQFRAVNDVGAFVYEGITGSGFTGFAPINNNKGFWICNAADAVFGCQGPNAINFTINSILIAQFSTAGNLGLGPAFSPSASYRLDVSGGIQLNGNLHFAAAGNVIIAPPTQLLVQTADGLTTNLTLTDAGRLTVRGGLTTGSGATAPGILVNGGGITVAGDWTAASAVGNFIPGFTSFTFRNNANTAPNLSIADGGLVTIGQASPARGLLSIPANSRFYLYGTGNQALTAGSFTSITLTGELKDTLNECASSAFTPAMDGVYVFTAAVSFNSITADQQRVALGLYKGSTEVVRLDDTESSGTGNMQVQGTAILDVLASDVYTIRVYAPAAQTTLGGIISTYFQGCRIC